MALATAGRRAAIAQPRIARGAMRACSRACGVAAAALAVMAIASADARPPGAYDHDEANAIIARVNDARAGAGLRPLMRDGALTRAAERHARGIAAAGALAHIAHDGSGPDTRAAAAGYAGWDVIAENLATARGAPDAQAILAAWMASASHRANVLAPDVRDAGAACYVTGGARGRSWCVLEFGARAGLQ